MHRALIAKLIIVAVLALGLPGCQAWRSVTAWFHSTDDLRILDRDRRVRYEAGAELLAETVAELLPEAMLAVESAQARPFTPDVRIFVFSSIGSFSARSAALPVARGSTFNGAIHLSPRLLEEPRTIQAILTHELSHLHLQQQIGAAAWARVPAWFHEGLAVSVSGGGGAEKVPAEAALRAIREGRSIRPEGSQNPFFPKTAHAHGLEQHMFYRQCELLVTRMRSSSPARFQKLMADLYSGKAFETSFLSAYEQPLEMYWSAFVAAVKADRAPRTDAPQAASP
jgi:hypothetical protein